MNKKIAQNTTEKPVFNGFIFSDQFYARVKTDQDTNVASYKYLYVTP